MGKNQAAEWSGDDDGVVVSNEKSTETKGPKTATSPEVSGAETDELPKVKTEGITATDDTVEFDLPEALPGDMTQAYALLHKLNGTKVNSTVAGQKKLAALDKVKGHIYLLQQGLRQVDITAHEYGKVMAKQRHIIARERIESIGRTHPEIKELIEAYDNLINQWNLVPTDIRSKIEKLK